MRAGIRTVLFKRSARQGAASPIGAILARTPAGFIAAAMLALAFAGHASAAPQTILTCAKPKTAAYYLNGIFTSQIQAENQFNALGAAYSEDARDFGPAHEIGLLYNYSAGADDVLEANYLNSLTKFLGSGRDVSLGDFTGPVDVAAADAPSMAAIRAARLADRIKQYNENWRRSAACFDDGGALADDEIIASCLHDPRFQMAEIESSLDAGANVVLIGYSEGSIFAELYRAFLSDRPAKVHNVLVGSPVVSALTSEPATLRIADPGDPVANLAQPNIGLTAATGAKYGAEKHMFVDSYLRHHREAIVRAIAEQSYRPQEALNRRIAGDALGPRFGVVAFDFLTGAQIPLDQRWDNAPAAGFVPNRLAPRRMVGANGIEEPICAQFDKISPTGETACVFDLGLYCADLVKYPRKFRSVDDARADDQGRQPIGSVSLAANIPVGSSPLAIVSATRAGSTLCRAAPASWRRDQCAAGQRASVARFLSLETDDQGNDFATTRFSAEFGRIESRIVVDEDDSSAFIGFDFDLQAIPRRAAQRALSKEDAGTGAASAD